MSGITWVPAWRPRISLATGWSALILTIFIVMALLQGLGYWRPDGIQLHPETLAGISLAHPFGTNTIGQDIWSRALLGTRAAVFNALPVALGSCLLGAILGTLAAWREGALLDRALRMLTDLFDVIPAYLLVATVVFAFPGSPYALPAALIAALWTQTARVVRDEGLRWRNSCFMQAAHALGIPAWRQACMHLLPHLAPVVAVQGSLAFVFAIKADVLLGFLGLGPHRGITWGGLLAESTAEILRGHLGTLVATSLLMVLLVHAVHSLSGRLQRRLDPHEVSL